MKTINDVRLALWEAYEKCSEHEDFCGKSGEGLVEVQYPSYWECKSPEQMLQPKSFTIYSYALGPSRRHYFEYSPVEAQLNYYTWKSPDPCSKAVEMIESWVAEFFNNESV